MKISNFGENLPEMVQPHDLVHNRQGRAVIARRKRLSY